jgi:hypothetical protein
MVVTDSTSSLATVALSNNQIAVGNTGTVPVAKTITAGKSVTVTNNASTIVLDAIQDLRTSATPTFNDITLTNLIANQLLFADSNKSISNMTLAVNGQLVIGSSASSGSVASTLGSGNSISITNGQGSISIDTIQDIRSSAVPTWKGVSAGTSGLTTSGSIEGTWMRLTNSSSQLYCGAGNGTRTICSFIAPTSSSDITLTFQNTSDTMVGRNTTDTLTNKTLTSPIITNLTLTNATLTDCFVNRIINTGTLLLPAISDTLVSKTSTDTQTNKTLTTPTITSIRSSGGLLNLPAGADTLVGRNTTDTLTNKTLTTPTITSIASTGGLLNLPAGADTLVGRNTTDTLTNKTLTTPTITNVTLTNATLVTPNITNLTLTNATLVDPAINRIINTGTLSLPTTSDTLVGRNVAETLTNKIFTTASNFIADTIDPTKTIRFSCSAQTTGIQGVLKTQFTGTKTITFPDITDTLVTKTSSDILKNKNLDSSNVFSLNTDNTRTVTIVPLNANSTNQNLWFTSASSRTYFFDDAGTTNSSVVVTEGAQTINGIKSSSN